MKSFLLIISFFTRIPVGNFVDYSDDLYKKSLVFFPLIGLIIGFFAGIPFLLPSIPSNLKSLLSIIIYLWISGAIHLDGLSDSVDGLLSNRSKDKILEIMKDSRIGAFGVIALIIYFLTFYTSLQYLNFKWILIMPFIGKSIGYIFASKSSYARKDQGMGYIFICNSKQSIGIMYLILNFFIIYVLTGVSGSISFIITFFLTYRILKFSISKIDGMTGDTIGMVIEVSQILFIFLGSLLIHF